MKKDFMPLKTSKLAKSIKHFGFITMKHSETSVIWTTGEGNIVCFDGEYIVYHFKLLREVIHELYKLKIDIKYTGFVGLGYGADNGRPGLLIEIYKDCHDLIADPEIMLFAIVECKNGKIEKVFQL